MFSGEPRDSKSALVKLPARLQSPGQNNKGDKKMVKKEWGEMTSRNDVRSFELELGNDGRLKAKERKDLPSIVGMRF